VAENLENAGSDIGTVGNVLTILKELSLCNCKAAG